MILREALARGAQTLGAAGIEGAARDARLLLAEATGLEASRLTLEGDLLVTPDQTKLFEDFLARRMAHEPVSKILGRRNFWGRDFLVTGDVLDPRPETESLIDLCLSKCQPKRILDMGCGSGIIAITLLAEFKDATGVASDISDACLNVTEQNASRHDVVDRLDLVKSNWFSDIKGSFDLIVSNPPYITEEEMRALSPDVAQFDPHIALTPGSDGLDAYKAIAEQAKDYLKPHGAVVVEIGWKQGADVCDIFSQAGFKGVRCHKDLNGHDRVIWAK